MRAHPAQCLSDSLRITEIFYSLQGESSFSGYPTTFVRLTGCPLRCTYCDTAYAFHGGKRMPLEEIHATIASHPSRHITITGGEPLAQPGVHALMTQCCDKGYVVSLETSGALDISRVDPRVHRILDLKTPGSGECDRNLRENIDHLHGHDEVKFVICDHDDFLWACDVVRRYSWPAGCQLWVSPSYEQCPAQQLSQWLIDTGLPQLRLQIQLHKVLACP